MMDLETWIRELLDDIQTAAENGENYDLHLEYEAVSEIADAYKDAGVIAIY